MGQETKQETTNKEKKVSTLGQAKKELKQKNVELEKAITAVEKAESARDVFLANMSHELRTPINTILGLNELILRESREETIKEYALDIRHAGNLLLTLISDILDFTKLEAGRMELKDGIYDISSLLNDLINGISIQLRKKKLDLELDIAEDIPYKLSGDEIHLRQIISNLLSNAVKYTDRGKVTLHLGWNKISENEIELDLAVKDTGVGIREKDLSKLFGVFQRMNTITKSKNESGTGLGLAITNRLVEKMGGKLEVQSTYGKGSVFSFKIVQKVVDNAPLGDFEKQYHESIHSVKNYQQKFIAPMGRVLIVDDNAMNLAVAQGLLKETRLQVDVASSGGECLELLKRKTYHIICLDHMMPVMDGVETLHAIRKLEDNPSADTPVIALTANAVAGAREFYMKEGFQDYLTKPIDADKFESILIKYLPDNIVYMMKKQTQAGDQGQENEAEIVSLENKLGGIGFNVRNGLKYMGNDMKLYGKVLQDFHLILKEKEDALRDFLKKRDMPGYAIIVHSLKGNARNVGADDLADEAFELEKMSKAGQLEDVEVRSPILFNLMKNIRKDLKAYLNSENKNTANSVKPKEEKQLKISDDDWRKALMELAGRLDDFDGDSVNEKLKELKRYDRPESDKKMLRLCEKAVKDYAYDVALEVVNAVL